MGRLSPLPPPHASTISASGPILFLWGQAGGQVNAGVEITSQASVASAPGAKGYPAQWQLEI